MNCTNSKDVWASSVDRDPRRVTVPSKSHTVCHTIQVLGFILSVLSDVRRSDYL